MLSTFGEILTMKIQPKWLPLLALLGGPAVAWSQPYASVQLGYADADFPLGPPYNGVVDDSAPMLGIEAGIGFGRKWAAEIGFHEYGSFDGFGTPCPDGSVCPQITQQIDGNDQTLYKIALVRRFEIGNVRLFGKAGYYQADLKSNVALPNSDFDPDGVLLGIGVRWYFSAPWSLSLEAERFDDNVSQISLGFGWGFGRDGDDDEYRDDERRRSRSSDESIEPRVEPGA
jgi:outer membrane protein with beta-barrel domain